MNELHEAQRKRENVLFEERLDAFVDKQLEVIFSEADTVGPDARHKLRGILKHYAKDPHPFRACVKDNMKRFGPGRTEAICATLKDIIRGTTKWRGHPELDHGSPGAMAASDFDDDVAQVLLSLSDATWEQVELNIMEFSNVST